MLYSQTNIFEENTFGPKFIFPQNRIKLRKQNLDNQRALSCFFRSSSEDANARVPFEKSFTIREWK